MSLAQKAGTLCWEPWHLWTGVLVHSRASANAQWLTERMPSGSAPQRFFHGCEKMPGPQNSPSSSAK